MWEPDPELYIDELIRESDETFMSLPTLESEPHLLISKVRKHYMDYIIKLLSVNYESNQRLLNKNIYLPSAIWRCAKLIESQAAQTCMVTQLYRKHITTQIKQLKTDTKKGKLYKKLYECLHRSPENEKNIQTTLNVNVLDDCTCQCTCNSRKRRRKMSEQTVTHQRYENNIEEKVIPSTEHNNMIPVLINSNIEYHHNVNSNAADSTSYIQTESANTEEHAEVNVPQSTFGLPGEAHDSDELLMQLEKLFQSDPNDDDLFDGTLCDTTYSDIFSDEKVKSNIEVSDVSYTPQSNDVASQSQDSSLSQSISLDERLASLSGILVTAPESNEVQKKPGLELKDRKYKTTKWKCEEYFLKMKLFGLLDEIGENNRKKLARVKGLLSELFGDDSDDEGVTSPLEETPEFVLSCKERIAPMVVKVLTPYYIKGRIIGKALFKSLAKHLIKLIYQCSKYPQEYEVSSFVTDFLKSHKMIRCEADFKQFRIENI